VSRETRSISRAVHSLARPRWRNALDAASIEPLGRRAFVHSLRCADGSSEVGSTTDLEARLHQHDLGLGSQHTRCRLPVVVVWHEELERVDLALARVEQVQNWSRRKCEALVAGGYDALPALAESHCWARVRAAQGPTNRRRR